MLSSKLKIFHFVTTHFTTFLPGSESLEELSLLFFSGQKIVNEIGISR
jgi:hypothetical protein